MFLELDSGLVEGMMIVPEGKELANVQASGILKGKDCTLWLNVQLWQPV